MKASALGLLIIFVASAAARISVNDTLYLVEPVLDEYVPIDDEKAEAAGLYKDGEKVSLDQLAAISERLLSVVKVDESGRVDPSQQNLVTGFYYKTDAALQLDNNLTVTFEENLKLNSSSKQLVDVIEDKERGTAYGVYLNAVDEPRIIPIRDVNDSVAVKVYSSKIAPNWSLGSIIKWVKIIINVVKVIVDVVKKLLPKCSFICPPWRNRVCAYSPTHGYRTFKNYCVLRRDICRGANFVYAWKGSC